MKNLTLENIQKYIKTLKKEGVNKETLKRKLTAVNKFLGWAKEKGIVSEDLFKQFNQMLKQVQHDKKGWLKNILYKEGRRKKEEGRKMAFTVPSELRAQHYVGIALVLVLMAALGAGVFNQFFNKTATPFAFPAQLTKPAQRYVSFQGRVTDSIGNPIATATNFQFKLYNAKSGGSSLYATGTCSLTPDQDGILNVLVGGSGLTTDQSVCGTGIPENIFSDFPNVYLGITIGADSEATPRQQIANVGFAVNAETLQGFLPGKDKSTVPYLDLNGDMLIATSGASLKSLYESANFTLASSKDLILQSAGPAAGAGDIILQATGSGALRLRTAGATDTQTRLLIDNSGNVGIGTTGPGAIFSVGKTGNATLSNIQTVTSGNALNIQDPTYAANKYFPGLIWTTVDNSPTKPKLGIWGQMTSTGSYLMFGTSNNYATGITNTAMTVDYTGKIGIGTVGPAAQLDVLAAASTVGVNLAGTQLAGNGSTAASSILSVLGATGQANSGATAGAGSALTLQTGAGGVASTSGTGGAGGLLSITGGTGGNGATTGGAGGGVTILSGSAGTGGNANGGTLRVDTGTKTGSGTSTLQIGNTNATALALGNASSTFALTSTGGLNVTTAGALTGVASLDTITTSSTALTFTSTAPTISVSTAATGISLEAGTTGVVTIAGSSTGGVNIAGSGTGDVNIAGGSASTGCTVTNSNGNLTCAGNITGGATGTVGYWTRTGTSLSPATANDSLAVNSGAGGTGIFTQAFTGTTTNAATITANSLTAGLGLSLSSTSTGLTTGGLLSLDWSPGSATTATGDLLSLNVGANGILGNIFNVKNNGSSVFSVSQTAVTSALPTAFTSAGDVSIAYDLLFTGSTSSNIKTSAPLVIAAGETFNSSDLTLRTYNSGSVVLDAAGGVTLAQAQNWDLANSSITSLNIESGLLDFDTTNSRVGIGTAAPAARLDVLAAASTVGVNLAGTQLAGNGSTAASSILSVLGATGQANSGATAGAGSALTLQTGAGGVASTSGTGGAGGLLSITGGTGGNGATTGGAGGGVTILSGSAGTGGNANGGTLTLNSGAITGSGTSTLNLGSANATTVNLATATSATTLNIGAVSTTAVTIALAGGSTDTGCTITGSNGNLACSGTITGVGAVGYWTKATTTLSPTTVNDVVSVTSNDATNPVLSLTSTGASANAVLLTANSTTTGNALGITANGLSSGNILSLTSSSTAAASNTQKGLNIALTGTNGTSAQTTYGAYISNAHAGTTSTNVGLYATATGGTTANYAAIFAAGNVGIGTTAPGAKLHVANTTAGSITTAIIDGDNGTSDGGSSIQLNYNGTAKWYIGQRNQAPAYSLLFGTGGTVNSNVKMVIDTGGNVGIGATAATARVFIAQSDSTLKGLVVRGTFSSGDYSQTVDFGLGTETTAGGIRFSAHSSGINALHTWSTWNQTNDRWESPATTTVGSTQTLYGIDGSIQFKTQPSAAVTAGDPITYNNTLTLLGSGNVGIGTTGPAELLTLASSGKLGWEVSPGTVDTNLYRGTADQLNTDDNLDVGLHLAVGNNASVDDGGGSSIGINLNENNITPTLYTGIKNYLDFTPGAANAIVYGDDTELTLNNSNANSVSSMTGDYTYISAGSGSGGITTVTGQNINLTGGSNPTTNVNGQLISLTPYSNNYKGQSIAITGAGFSSTVPTSASAIGQNIDILALAGKTITDAYGQKISLHTCTGRGCNSTITNAYGAYVNNLVNAAGTITNNYSLYVNNVPGTASSNYGLYIAPQTGGVGLDVSAALGAAADYTLWLSNNADNTAANAGIFFGASADTNLYRSAASTLTTDGSFTTTAASGTQGWWNKTSTTLSPVTANDVVSVSSNDATNPVFSLTSTGASANAMLLTADSTTTGNALGITANGLSSGNILSLTSSSTAAASNTQKGLNIALSGANVTAGQTTYATYISNAHTGGTSTINYGTYILTEASGVPSNVALYASAQNGSLVNYAGVFDHGFVIVRDGVAIGVSAPLTSLLSLLGSQPASVGTTPGTAANAVLTATAGGGGDTTIATTGVGGIGGALALTGGVGGLANSATTADTGGKGGALTLTTGAGGAAAATGGIKIGGAGGDFVLAGGVGGNTSGTGTSNTGGAGGTLYLYGGTGGTASGATANTAGAAGNVLLAIDSGGTARGRVGIGTTGPEGALSVVGDMGIGAIANTDQANHMLDIASTKGSTNNSAIRALYPGGGSLAGTEFGALAYRDSEWKAAYAKAGTGGAIALYTDGEVNMMNGNVGIGTTAPADKLNVSTAINKTNPPYTPGLIISDSTAYAAGVGGGISFNGIYNSSSSSTSLAVIDAGKANSTDGDWAGNLRFWTRQSTTDASLKMLIDSVGSVGIGTTAPISRLHVSGQTKGKALAIFDETGTNQDLLTASASGVTKFTVDHSGVISTSSVGTAAIRTNVGSSNYSNSTNIAMQSYTFFPYTDFDSCTGSPNVTFRPWGNNVSPDDYLGRFRLEFSAACGTGSILVGWTYITASDHPTIWTVAKDDNSIIRVWQAADPINPFEYPKNPNPWGNEPLPQGQSYASPSPLTIDQLQIMLSSLPLTDQAAIIKLAKDYIVTERNWLESFNDLIDIRQISERYQPTARFEIMRFIAKYYNLDPANLIQGTMDVSAGQLTPKSDYYNVLQTFIAQRAKAIAENKQAQTQLNKDLADLAEYYPTKSVMQPGDIVEAVPHVDPEEGEAGKHKILLVKTTLENSPKIMGVISTSPAQTLNENPTNDQVPLALSGRVPVRVTNLGGAINVGDAITSSLLPGTGMRSKQAGTIVGKALESFSCQSITNCQDIEKVKYWVNQNGDKVENPQNASEEIYPVTLITMFVNTSWYDPDTFLTSIQKFQLDKKLVSATGQIQWQLTNTLGEVVKRVGAFSEIASAYVKAGLINTQELIAVNITSTEKITSPIIETTDLKASGEAQLNQISTNVIKPQNNDVTIDLSKPTSTISDTESETPQNDNGTTGPLAKIIVKGLNGKTVSTIDAAGNASFSGTLAAKEATISGTLSASQVNSQSVNSQNVSVSGTLNADQIQSKTISELQDRLTLAAADSGQAKTTSQELSTSVNNIQSLLADIRKQPLSDPQYYQSLDNNPVVGSLTVSGDTTLYNATIATSLTAGTISIENNQLISLTTELKLSALSSVNILDGAVVITRDGTMTTKGTIIAKGGIEVQNSDLRFKNKEGVETASIDSSGSAKFKSLALDKYLDATTSAIIATPEENFNKNGLFASAIETQKQTAGVGLVPVNNAEIIIYNDSLKENSLIYLTPTTQTNSQLTVAQKKTCGPQSPSNCKPYFKVASNQPIHSDVGFNWLIIN